MESEELPSLFSVGDDFGHGMWDRSPTGGKFKPQHLSRFAPEGGMHKPVRDCTKKRKSAQSSTAHAKRQRVATADEHRESKGEMEEADEGEEEDDEEDVEQDTVPCVHEGQVMQLQKQLAEQEDTFTSKIEELESELERDTVRNLESKLEECDKERNAFKTKLDRAESKAKILAQELEAKKQQLAKFEDVMRTILLSNKLASDNCTDLVRCAVCLDTYNSGNQRLDILDCGHWLCRNCSAQISACHLCRRKVPKKKKTKTAKNPELKFLTNNATTAVTVLQANVAVLEEHLADKKSGGSSSSSSNNHKLGAVESTSLPQQSANHPPPVVGMIPQWPAFPNPYGLVFMGMIPPPPPPLQQQQTLQQQEALFRQMMSGQGRI